MKDTYLIVNLESDVHLLCRISSSLYTVNVYCVNVDSVSVMSHITFEDQTNVLSHSSPSDL